MRPVSESFLNALRGSHRMVSRARLIPAGLTGVNPGPLNDDGSPVYELPIRDGDVQFDANADVRATLSLTVHWPWPDDESDLMNPYGSEIFVERGIRYGTGVREWVALGYYRIEDVHQADVPNGPLAITAKDRMAGIIEARTLTPIVFPDGTDAQMLYTALINEVYPSVPITYDFDPETVTWQGNHVLEEDRFKFLKEVTESLGKIAYFEYDGTFRVESPPDSDTPLWTINHGRDGVLVSASRKKTRDGIYNAVVAEGDRVGEGDAEPVREYVLDEDPASPTYWWGGFGKIPKYFNSSFIRNSAQAIQAATTMLARAKGLPYSVDLGFIPNPGLEVLDPVLATYSDKDLPEVHVLDSMRISLEPKGVMTATSRKVKDGVD